VVGLTRDSRGRIALITLDRSILRLHFADGGSELLFEAPAAITSCTVSPTTGLVALLTAQCQLVVLSAVSRERLLMVQTWQPPHDFT
jgi:hypothetical protein